MFRRFAMGARPVAAAAIAIALAASADAATDRWTATGPSGGLLETIAVDPGTPGTVYAGGFNAGVFRSLDAGVSWTAVGPRNERIFSITVDSRRGIVYAGANNGLFQSRDQGTTWALVDRVSVPWPHSDDTPPSSLLSTPTAVRFDAANPLRVYVGAMNDVFVSDDGGESFAGVATPFTRITSLAQSAASPSLLFAGADGIYRSTDSAVTWKPVLFVSTPVNAIACDPGNAAIAYAATGSRILKTTDGGDTWFSIADHPTSAIIDDVILDPSNPRRVLVPFGREGVYESLDGGATWSVSHVGDDVFTARLAVSAGGPIFAATDAGVFQQSAAGSAWRPTSVGLNATLVECLASDESSGTLLAGTFFEHLYRSPDAGASWQRVFLPEPADSIYELAIDPADPRRVFARTNAGVLISTDGGQAWTFSFPNTDGVKALRMSLQDPKTLYLATGPFFEDQSHLYRTTDGGRTWALVADPPFDVGTLVADPRDSRVLYAGVVPNGTAGAPAPYGGFFKSVDGGASWIPSNGGLDPANLPWFTRVAIDPANPSSFYAAATYGGIYKSADGGASWRSVGAALGGRYVLSIAVHPRSSSIVLAGTVDGIYASFDSGETWRTMNEGLAGNDFVTDFQFRPGTDTVRIATNGGGVQEREISTRPAPEPPGRPRRGPIVLPPR